MWQQIPGDSYHHEYRTYLSSSDLRRLLRSPAHYRASPASATPAQEMGTLVHERILEPDMWQARCRKSPKIDRRTKEGKALADWQASQELEHGIKFIDEDTYDKIEAIAHSVHTSLGASGFLAGGVAELSGFTTISDTNIRVRPDYLRDDLIVDLKTCQDAREFSKSVFSWGYEVQAALYLDAAELIDGKKRRFLWIAVEKDDPYGVSIFEPDESVLERGRAQYLKAIEVYKECAALDYWPGYTTAIQTISLPGWMK